MPKIVEHVKTIINKVEPQNHLVPPATRRTQPKRFSTGSFTSLKQQEQEWLVNRARLNKIAPNIFNSRSFTKLPYIGGRSEGDVRELVLKTPLTISSGKSVRRLAIKKFKPGHTKPQNSAHAIHSFSFLLNYLKTRGLIRIPFEVDCVEIITHQGPFLVMPRIPENYVRASKLPQNLKDEVKQFIISLNDIIYSLPKKTIEAMKSSGFIYPSPDLIASNILVNFDNTQIKHVYIIDQFSDKNAEDPRFKRKSKTWLKRKWNK
jgi:hypothetical protein